MIKKVLILLSLSILLEVGGISKHTVQAESLVDLDTQNHNAALPPTTKTTEPKFPNTSTLSNNLVQVSQDIQENTEAIQAADKSQNELQVDIQNLEKDIQVVKERLENRTTILKERALAYQHSDKQLTYIEVLLEASSLNDFLDRVGAVAAFAEADQVLIEQQKSEQQVYARKQANLNKKLTSLAELTDNLKIRRTQLEKKQAEFKQMALQLEASPSHIVNPINAQNGYVHTVINAGRKYIGNSVYVFGGGRTASDIAQGRFDCSGFVHWAFSQAGIEIGRDTSSIKNDGRQVSAANIQPGDLVFFDTYKKDGHVGIYIGDGKFIGSQSSTGVAIADMTKGYWKTVFNGQVIRI